MSETTTTTAAGPVARPRAACAHTEFEATVNINREPLTATLQVRCASCKLPMRFSADGHTTATLAMMD